MAEHFKNSIKKRRTENTSQMEAADGAKSITNIYYDCLERMFAFLDIDYLLMVAQTCKRLQMAAAAKFGDEYSTKRFKLHLYGHYGPSIFIGSKAIKVATLKFCLPFLRCFGAHISYLTVDYYFHKSQEKYCDQYINQYCADTLADFSIHHKSEFSDGAFEISFKKVETFQIRGCDLTRELMSSLVNRFPNMRQLTCRMSYVKDVASLDVHFPLLQHLKLIQLEDGQNEDYNENAINILRSNRQLQSLEIHSDYELELDWLLNNLHGNSAIAKLKVFSHVMNDGNRIELESFVGEHQLLRDLCFVGFRLPADDAINFIHQMESLKRIEFQVHGHLACDRIRNRLENEWNVTISTDHVDFNYGDGDLFYIAVDRQ